ncbi:MAG: peptidylprolyl isomerase, partial [Roseibium sp.]|nr:peptidylprolyl isomerase [Roseibium sp.]
TVASTNGAAANSRLILSVSGTETPSFDASATEVATLGDQLSQQLQDSLLGQFVTEQENQAGVEINQAGIARVIGLDNNSHY